MTIRITIELYISCRFPLRIFGQAAVSAEIGRIHVGDLQLHMAVVMGWLTFHLFQLILSMPVNGMFGKK